MKRQDEGEGEGLDPRAEDLFQLAQASLGHMSPVQQARGIVALRARRGVEGRLRIRRRFMFGAVGMTAATAAALVFIVPKMVNRGRTQSEPLSFEIKGGALDSEGTIRPQIDAEPALHFADGTVIALAQGTKGRLAKVDGRGARVSISDGLARVNVVPKKAANWLIDAGPFLITVHGTIFTASWNEAEERLDIRMQHGLVSVSGPVATGPVAVRAGQRLTISLHKSQVLLRELDQEDEAEPAVAEAPPPARMRTVDAPARRASRASSTRNWAAALSAGDFDAVLADAEQDLTRALASRSSDDLAALADAARYRRHNDVARRALHAQRRRFPGSARAADAAFFLGRLDENGGGSGMRPALRWYDRYLDEAPNGSYAAEALGRKMVAIRELTGAASAQDVADQYIRRFPRGSYAGTARAIRVER